MERQHFFEYYADDLERTLFKKTVFLYDLNMNLLSMCLGWLQWSGLIKESVAYEKDPMPLVRNIRSCIKPKGIEQSCKFYQPIAYQQVFGNAFVENLSLIDLIFCKGPEAVRIVHTSHVN